MKQRSALVTGFEPYGGRGINPAAEVVKRLDGLEIDGVRVVGRIFPVSFADLSDRVRQAMRELGPEVAIGLGLWPGEPAIRLERIAVNLADFEIPDNDALMLRDEVVEARAPAALETTLPLRAIERALLQAGIPARLSTTAGTFLCNATMYSLLAAAPAGARVGFMHLPYLPEQVAALLEEMASRKTLELHQRADLASMSLVAMLEAVRIALAVSVGAPRSARESRRA